MLASQEGYLEIVQLLVEVGANVNIVRQGNALMSAASNGHKETFDYLYPLTNPKFHIEALEILSNGIRMREFQEQASPNTIALIDALLERRYDDFQTILATGIDVNSLDEEGCTAIFVAVLMDSREAVHTLLEAGANPDLGNMMDGRTPLMILTHRSNESLEICNLLLQYGASIDATDQNGITPLIHAILPLEDNNQRKSVKHNIISIILENRANVNHKDFKDHKNALMHLISEPPRNDIEALDKQEVYEMLVIAGSNSGSGTKFHPHG